MIAYEAELAQVCEAGRNAEAAFIESKSNELRVRNEDAQRSNAYNAASRKLANVTNAPLPHFYTNADAAAKLEAIAQAQQELDAVQAENAVHPLAIPQAVQAVQAAERKLSELIAREKELRDSIATLRGEPVQATNATTRFNGLQR